MLEANPQLTPGDRYATLRTTAARLDCDAFEAALGLDPTPHLRTIGSADGAAVLPKALAAADTPTFALSVPEAGPVPMAVYDLLGREVDVLVDQDHQNWTCDVTLHAAGLAAGTSLVRLEAAGRVAARSLTLTC